MSFQVYLPICRLEQSPSLVLFLFHIYFKCSSFCLCHSSLSSLSLVLCQPAKISLFPSPKQPTYHLPRLAGSKLAPLLSPLVGIGKERHGDPHLKQLWAEWPLLLIPLLCWTFISQMESKLWGLRMLRGSRHRAR